MEGTTASNDREAGQSGASEIDAPEPELLALAHRIREERDYLKFSQFQISEVLGIPRAAVSAIETGRRRVTSVELTRLAEVFGTSVDRLLGRELEDDPTAVALFRTAKSLTNDDRLQVLRFAEFLRKAGPAPSDDAES
jgi:transcriptional regulator with XRE-family HTH domain